MKTSPYREADGAAQLNLEKQKRRAQLSMFGIRQRPNGELVPILERVETNQCRNCSGFGTGGNPLCGAVYTCTRCHGTGHDPVAEKVCRNYFYRFINYFYRFIKDEKEGSNAG
jgi:hypothetical protein